MNRWIRSYLEEQVRIIRAIPVEEVTRWINHLVQARREHRQVFICGNGGNAANASHFAVDLGKGSSGVGVGPVKQIAVASSIERFRVLSLADNVSWLTALGNDVGFDDVFVEQLRNHAKKGDFLIGVSVSGNSPNVVKAIEWAKDAGLVTLALVGGKQDSRMAQAANHILRIDSTHYGRVEDAQMNVLHLLCYSFIEQKA